MINYLIFKTEHINQTMVGTNPSNNGQCEGLIEKWLAENNLPFVGGNAKDFYNNAPDQYFEKLPANSPVEQGYIFVCGPPWGLNPYFDPNKPEGPNNIKYYGHIGFVDQPEQGLAFMGFEQNGVLATPNKVQIVFHQTRNGLIGFLRLRNQEEIMDKNDSVASYWNGVHRRYDQGQVSDQEINGRIGKKYSDVAAQERTSSEWLTINDILLRAYPLAQQQINDLTQKIQQLQAQPSQQEVQTLKDEVAALTDTTSHLGSQ